MIPQYISRYLTFNEYKCKCCDQLPPSFDADDIPTPFQILFDNFDFIREAWGKPIFVTSGYRCPMHNSMVGGKVLSVHMFGLALDMDCDSVDDVLEMDALIQDICPDLRRGTYTDSGTFIHIDSGYFIYPKATEVWEEGKRWTG